MRGDDLNHVLSAVGVDGPRWPSMAVAYLLARGTDLPAALARVRESLGRRPVEFLVEGLADADRMLATTP